MLLRKKKFLQRIFSVFMVCIFCFVSFVPAQAFQNSNSKMYLFEDGSKRETRVDANGTEYLTEYDINGNEDAHMTVTEDDVERIAIFEHNENVTKLIYNKQTEHVQMYRRNINESDNAYVLFYDSADYNEPESNSGFPVPNKVLETFRFGTYFKFDWYEYDDNSHTLAINQQPVDVPANTYLKECNSFLQHAIDSDNNLGYLIIDICGFIPGAGTVANACHIIYSGSVTGDTSAMIADALFTYLVEVAKVVCPPASVISAGIDGYNLIYSFRNVYKNYNKVKNA